MRPPNIKSGGEANMVPGEKDRTERRSNEEIPAERASDGSSSTLDYAIPDGGYGWVCVGCCFIFNALTWGVVASYGVYLSYYLANSTFPGATSTDFAYIGGLEFAMAMLASPLVTLLTKRVGMHPPMFAGVLLFGGGFVAASFASQLWHLYLSQGVCIGLGVGFLYLPSIGIIPQWFDRRRSLAAGICAAGSGIGGLTFSLSTGVMMRNLSLAWALRITGITTASVCFVAVALVRSRDAVVKPDYKPFDIKIIKTQKDGKNQTNLPALLLLAWEFIMLFGYITIQFSLSAFTRSLDLTPSQSDQVTALLNLGTALGRPFIGFLSDHFGRIKVALLLTLATSVLCFALWIPATSFAVALVFAIPAGAIYGVFWATVGPLCAEVVPLTQLPSMLSLAWLTAILPTAFAETISLKLRRPSEGDREYLYPQIFSGLSYLVAAGIMWWLLWETRRRKVVTVNE